VPDVVTLPQLFKQNSYESRSIGKIFHVTNGNHEDDLSWSTHAWQSPKDDNPNTRRAAQQARAKAAAVKAKQRSPEGEDPHADDLPFESPEVADNKLIDGQIADKAVSTLNELKDRPFFLAVGFHKPHMPWIAPKKYWDLYDPATIHLADYQDLPAGAPVFASNDASEFRRYMNVPKQGPLPDDLQRNAIHGYFACVSFVDAQIGRVINELDRLGLRKNTVVVLWGDHGYQLGEHGTWNKRTNWEVAARVPLIVSVPGQQHPGQQTSALVELLDMYPTLVQLCGLRPPAELEGRSFVPLLRKPDLPWKQAVFTMVTRRIPEMGSGFGRSLRTDRYRFVEWYGSKSDKRVYELYDEVADPLEKTNLADRPENAELVAKLTKQLHDVGK
jgi:arylsulfatase A-like enzyme